jgi:UDP-glucose 4-epimerase
LILVTGGAGFVGSHLVDALADAGEDPVVLDNFASGDRENLREDVRLIEADIADPGVVNLISDLRPEVIVHAAAQVSVAVSMQDPHLDLTVNVQGTANVLEGAKVAGTRRFVFISSGGGVYGESDGADENTLPRPKSYYSTHKYVGERYVELSGLSYANARLANVYGSRQRSDLEGGVVAIFTERLQKKQSILINGTGEQQRDLIYVRDVVDSLLTMAKSDRDGTWNVGTGRSTSILELLRALEDQLEPAVEVRHGPPRPGDVKNSRLEIRSIRDDLGWEPRYGLAEGISEMLGRENATVT